MSEQDDLEARYFYIQVHGRLLGEVPVCCVHLTRQGEDAPTHTLILTLDQADSLQLDLENSKMVALNEYIIRRAAFNQLEQDLENWTELKPPEDTPDE